MRIYKFIILLFILSCQSKVENPSSDGKEIEGKAKMYKFYDFDFEFTMFLEPVGISERFILKNHSIDPSQPFRKYRLYYTQYANNERRIMLSKPDTLSVKLDRTQLDSIYSITSKYFQLNYKDNISPYKVPPPPIGDSEWASAQISLDLGYWGDKHTVFTGSYNKLYQFLLKIKNKSH